MITLHRIELEEIKHAYRVWFQGKILIERTRDPEFNACRILLKRGITGRITTYSKNSNTPRMNIDIKHGANCTTKECEKRPPHIAKWNDLTKDQLANLRTYDPQPEPHSTVH